MIWQQTVLTVGGMILMIFSLGLLVGPRVTRLTSLPTFFILTAFGIVYWTMNLKIAGVTMFAQASVWLASSLRRD